jgi:hypothetical protein
VQTGVINSQTDAIEALASKMERWGLIRAPSLDLDDYLSGEQDGRIGIKD